VAGIDRRVARLEEAERGQHGLLSPQFATEDGHHTSASMVGIGMIVRTDGEPNHVFEQRVFVTVLDALSKGKVRYHQVSDGTLKACLAAQAMSLDVFSDEMISGWFATELGERGEAGEREWAT